MNSFPTYFVDMISSSSAPVLAVYRCIKKKKKKHISKLGIVRQLSVLQLTVSVGHELGSSLAGWFFLMTRVSWSYSQDSARSIVLGWRIYFRDVWPRWLPSQCWLLTKGLSSPPCGRLHRLLEVAHNMAVPFAQSQWPGREQRQCSVFSGLVLEVPRWNFCIFPAVPAGHFI